MPTVYITVPPDHADSLATSLVERGLAACVNSLPCQSVYRWDGDVHHDTEQVLLAKTTTEGYDALVEYVVDAHPHDVPCIERFDETDVLPAFAEWRADAVDADG
jgi:periplasmic divalent cation tolerance protein